VFFEEKINKISEKISEFFFKKIHRIRKLFLNKIFIQKEKKNKTSRRRNIHIFLFHLYLIQVGSD